jgi:hypothetical protein
LEDVRGGLGDSYSSRRDGEVLFVRNLETESEFVIEQFGSSVQIRQAVTFGCGDLADAERGRIYRLCSDMNERFSGCKAYVDRWGALLTAADVLGESTPGLLEVVLGQVEFMSLAMHSLAEIVIDGKRMPDDEEIDAALRSPSLH